MLKEIKKLRVILATRTSQFLVMENLIKNPKIKLRNCEIFYLDEYIGLTPNHPASFVRFIKDDLFQRYGQLLTSSISTMPPQNCNKSC
jgi:glucosamine-6-phosphate deaminase